MMQNVFVRRKRVIMQNDKFELLRQKAEELLSQKKLPQQGEQREMLELLHELAVNQIELEVQNEELRDTQIRLEETMNKYFELYEFAPVGYLNINDCGIITTVNLKAVKMFDIPRSKMLGRALGGFVVPAFQDKFFNHLRGVLADTKSHSCELAIIRPDHTNLFVQIESVYAEHSKKGEGKIIRSAVIDITELNRTRQEIDGLNKNLEKKVIERTAVAELRLNQLKTLNLELIRAEQCERLRLAELLHDDLQQLLVGCQLNISFLRKGKHNQKKTDIFERTNDILKTAIKLSRSLSYELCPPVLSQGGLPEALNWLKERKKTLNDFDMHLHIDPNIPRLPVDIEIFFFQCAKELLLNAIKHGKTTEADFSLKLSKGRLILSVSDNGVGCQPGAFEDSSHKKEGFGLVNIKNRLETMDGSFEVHSKNKGFTVTLTLPISHLPISDPQVGVKTLQNSAVDETPLPKVKKASIKVMLVDDHRILRKGIRHLLEMEGDIAVIAEAENGLQAVELACSHEPDVILMDVGLPLMDGIKATAEITQKNHNIRVIGLSIHESDGFLNKMIEAGASQYLTKNVPVQELVHAIRTEAAKAPSQ